MNLAIKILWPDPAPINSEASTTLAFYLPIGVVMAGPAGQDGIQGPQGEQGPPGSDADTTALREELLGTGGGSTVSNGTYDGTTLHYTGGEIVQGSGAFGGVIDQAGVHSIELVVPDFQGSAQIIYFVNDTPSLLANPSPENLFYGGFTLNQSTQLPAFLAAVFPDSDVDPQLISRDVAVGDIISLTISNNNSTLTVTLNGTEIWSATTTKVLAETYTHLMFTKTVESDTIPDVQVSGLAAAGTPGLIDTLIHDQVDPVISAQLSIYQRLDTIESVNTAQTLAQQATQTDLDALTTEVSTKATPADISAAIAALVDGAPASLDTLSEIAAALAGDQASINDLLTQINNRVRFDAAQSLTTAQQLQARQNINAETVGVAAALIAAITAASIGAATAAQGAKADSALQSGDVAPVALSGSYTSLINKPTIVNPVNADWNSNSGLSQILNKPVLFDLSSLLTGLGAGSNTVITAADSLINALAKLQAQASANAELLAPVPRKIGPSWYVSGRWYDQCHPLFLQPTTATVPAGAVQFVPMCPVDTLTAQQIGINLSTAAAAGSKIRLGVYADNAGIPGARLYDSGDIASDSTGTKMALCTQTFTAGARYWLALYSSASVGVYVLLGTAMGQVNLTGWSSAYSMSGQSGLPATAAGAVFSGMHGPRIMLQAG